MKIDPRSWTTIGIKTRIVESKDTGETFLEAVNDHGEWERVDNALFTNEGYFLIDDNGEPVVSLFTTKPDKLV